LALTFRAARQQPWEAVMVPVIAQARSVSAQRQICAAEKRGQTMKRIAWAALAATAIVALYAGRDDIRRFHRMRSM
jgi:hypothetical protein